MEECSSTMAHCLTGTAALVDSDLTIHAIDSTMKQSQHEKESDTLFKFLKVKVLYLYLWFCGFLLLYSSQ